jgi:hypothetical protein
MSIRRYNSPSHFSLEDVVSRIGQKYVSFVIRIAGYLYVAIHRRLGCNRPARLIPRLVGARRRVSRVPLASIGRCWSWGKVREESGKVGL